MKEYIVSIYVRSRSIDLAGITRLMGVEPNGGHNQGEVGGRGDRCYLDNFWWLDSGAGDEATMEVHGESLIASLSMLSPEVAPLASSGDLEVSIGVGIMSDTYTTSVRLPRELVAFASRIGASFEVSSYPTEFEAGDSR